VHAGGRIYKGIRFDGTENLELYFDIAQAVAYTMLGHEGITYFDCVMLHKESPELIQYKAAGRIERYIHTTYRSSNNSRRKKSESDKTTLEELRGKYNKFYGMFGQPDHMAITALNK